MLATVRCAPEPPTPLTGCIWGCCWLQGFGRAVLTGFKHANFRIKYADGSERSLKRAEILRYYAASLA